MLRSETGVQKRSAAAMSSTTRWRLKRELASDVSNNGSLDCTLEILILF